MITTANPTTKTKKAIYWLATALTATAYLAIGTADLMHAPAIMAGMAHLGYPFYLTNILGVWKLLGTAAIIAPGLRRLKEWAYAGMFFDLTGAALSHAASGGLQREILAPLGLLVVVLISLALRSARGAVPATQVRAPQIA